MTKEELFEIWAPTGGRWSPWVKPVLFACVEHAPAAAATAVPGFGLSAETNVDGIPPSEQPVALVVDLPGAESVQMGMTLAAQGYRPVPLFNAVPGPRAPIFILSSPNATAVVDVHPILAALQLAAGNLQKLDLSPEAPPAFLLDANRRGGAQLVAPGRFDNRSIAFTTDFPSATFLVAQGIQQAVLIQSAYDQPQPDLAHTLRRWQEGGITIASKRVSEHGAPVPIVIKKPSAFGWLWQRALSAIGLRRHGLGGFGGMVPTPSAG